MKNKTTFWNYLKNNDIEIPIIQRDYAQGRLGKENLRKNFLMDLKKALDNESPYSKTAMKLDFVYGSTEGGILKPLDGQQRLTTLWLLHWYIALCAGVLNKENCKVFNRFTYETRISSREFCEKLCESEHFEKFEGDDIVGFITKQTWFYSAWKQDPTIQSMLRMLGGTKITDKKGEDIVDGIEELFQNTNEDVFKDYWQILTEKETIVYYHLPLSDFGLSDDLYIKMNARGKQLTSFENFKADLIGYITMQSEDETLDKNIRTEWGKLLDPKDGVPIKLDTGWTDIFWKNRSNDNRIDEVYFAFINRFFLQELICAKKEDNLDYLFSANDLEEKNDTFKYLYGNKSDDSQLQYSGLERYLYKEKTIPHSLLKNLSCTLENYKTENLICFPEWVDSKFEFIPKYNDAGQISTLGQKERVVFLAVCKYLEKGEFENTSFGQWMRVVWDIVENSGIETISAMIGAMRLIYELSEHSHAIYTFLLNPNSKIESDFAKEQVAEEIVKAKQICQGKLRADEKSREEIIIKAESYAFFKGAIRFLFTDDKGIVEWCDFDTKWENAQKYFDEDGVKDDEEKFKSEAVLLKAVLYNVKDFWKCIEPQKYVFDNKAETWKSNILLEKGWENAVHQIMMGKLEIIPREGDSLIYKNLYSTNLLNYVSNHLQGSRIRWIHDHRALYPPYYDGILLDDENRDNKFYRNRLLSSDSRICSNQKIEKLNYYKGWDIFFEYEGRTFQWNTDEKIYLLEDGIRKHNNENENYCADVTNLNDSQELINKLDCLIAQAYPESSDKACCNDCQDKICE